MLLTASRGIPSERVKRQRERLLSAPYEIDIERARYYTQSWKRNESEPPCTRAALALEETLRRMRIRIDDDEILVGCKTFKPLAGVIPVERGEFNVVLETELDRLVSRERSPFLISDEERKELEEEILPYWRGRTVRSRKIELWKQEGIWRSPFVGPIALIRIIRGAGAEGALRALGYAARGGGARALLMLPRKAKELAGLRPHLALTVFDVQGHMIPGYRRVLEVGYEGIASEAARLLEELDSREPAYAERKDFLSAVRICAGAVCDHAARYAELAERMASTAGLERAAELEAIAERCRQVPAKPPRNFLETLQSIWMSQVVESISYGMAEILSPGRVDQYLYPYYKSDLKRGIITREKALEAIEEYMVKLGGFIIMLVEIGKDTASEMGVGSNTLTIGGLDRYGKDATNEVSHLFLEAHENVRSLATNLSVRISRSTPREFLLKAVQSYRYTSGHAFFNDEVIVGELEKDGISREDALDYGIVGCVEPAPSGNAFPCTAGNDISLAAVLEMALNRGRLLFSGRRVGVLTPDPCQFTSFEEVTDAFSAQLSHNIAQLVMAVELLDEAYAENFPTPLVSSAVRGCLESARDLTRGGARYNFGSITGRGLGTVIDSLAAIYWAVFEQRIVSMRRLMKALRKNFRGEEKLRMTLLRKAPKYGNGDHVADELGKWVANLFCEEVRKHPCARGGFYRPGIFSYGVHVVDGLFLGATPDGRLAGEPVSNGISPVNGMEMSGPTATLRSAASVGAAHFSDGTALNMRLSPILLEGGESAEKIADLVRGYFMLGGRHVQFNVVDTQTLRDAQAHPEKYRDLVVRVSGYCAYFTDLGKPIQDDIIARAEFASL